ncbi:MAG: calcium-binding protein [Verrucomicrobiaceae bacterium]
MKFQTLLLLTLSATFARAEFKAGDPIDYSKLAFYPDRWAEKKIDTQMYPWEGRHVALITLTDGLDAPTIEKFLARLDGGWEVYQKFTGKNPRLHRNVNGKATICALPHNGLSCGYGCGYVGSTGIEMTHFYDGHLPGFEKNNKAIPHAYYYEMGRNFYTYGHKHSVFTTGFAVFMRYVCIDQLKGYDNDPRTRETINRAIDVYARSDLKFLNTFTNAVGGHEKGNRLDIRPSDQNVMYASAMLKLWKEHGDDWLKSFYQHLDTAPAIPGEGLPGARSQCLTWYLASSLAAKKDLAPTFVDQWRLPLTDHEKAVLKTTTWTDPALTVTTLLKKISPPTKP